MFIDPAITQKVQDRILKSRRIILISHRNPDSDSIGSNLAMRHYMEKIGKKVFSVCSDPIPHSCRFLPKADLFTNDFDFNENDLLLAIDTSSMQQIGFENKKKTILRHKNLIIIDHHHTNPGFGTINLIYHSAAATTIIIYHLLSSLKAKIDPAMATCLLSGLYGDTGSFMHSNTNEEALEVASILMRLGAQRELIIKNLYKNKTIEQLYLWGKIFSDAVLTKKNILVSAVKNEDLQNFNTDHESISGAIDHLNTIKGSDITALLSEDQNGNIRGSLRTKREDIDLTEIAKSFGGGGHTKASGFTIPGKLKKETQWKIV